jgi:vancomycin permeability regulator SanA
MKFSCYNGSNRVILGVKPMKIRIILICILALTLLPIFWIIYQYHSILAIGEFAAPEPADVIIILGASVWPLGPSPALQARIERGEYVYAQGLADYFIVTGGLGAHPPAEAEAMKQELVDMGIDPRIILLEDSSTSTLENLIFSKTIMAEHNFETAIIVTDVFHTKRALLMAKDLDIKASAPPARESPLYTNEDLRRNYTLREVLALTWYYLYRIFRL